MAVTLEIGPNGSTVMVEPVLRKGLTRRVFRYMADGSLEWAAYDDWRSQHERARFFGFASRELPASSLHPLYPAPPHAIHRGSCHHPSGIRYSQHSEQRFAIGIT